MSKGKAYRSLSIRLAVEDFESFEKAQEILQNKAKKSGIETTVSKPDLLKHLVKLFLEQNSSD